MSKRSKVAKMTDRLNDIHREHYKQQSHQVQFIEDRWWLGPNLAATLLKKEPHHDRADR